MSDPHPYLTRNCSQELADFFHVACKGDADAITFLLAWHEYTHEIDDLVDECLTDPEAILKVLSHAIGVYSSRYYQAHVLALWPIALLVTNTYATSVQFEHAAEPWKQNAADVLRHCAGEMTYAVAELCGGWEHRRQVTMQLAEAIYQDRNVKEDN